MICIYHKRDFDGHCAAAIVRHANPDVRLIGRDYGEEPDFAGYKDDDLVIVDFSFPIATMQELSEHYNVIWLDHHISAIFDAEAADYNPPGRRLVSRAGCELTWDHFFPFESMPKAVHLIGRYDVWDHEDPKVQPFQFALRYHKFWIDNPDADWNRLLTDDAYAVELLGIGYTLQRYQDQQDAKSCRTNAFVTEIHGLKVIALNADKFGSLTFKSIWDPRKYDAMLCFRWCGELGKWLCSLYTDDRDDIDVSLVAKQLGGGGHKGAAGFQVDQLPFELTGNQPAAEETIHA